MLNAIAFDAQWKEDYEDEDLKTGDFKNCDGSISTITTLSSRESDYIENETFTGFIKPYKNDRFSFMALLPKEDILHIDAKVLNAMIKRKNRSNTIPMKNGSKSYPSGRKLCNYCIMTLERSLTRRI